MKNFIKRNDFIIRTYSFVYNLIGLSRARVRGKKNAIKKGIIFQKKTRIKVSGNNNLITLGNMSRFNNIDIRIVGNDNELTFSGRNNAFRSRVIIEGNLCRLYIGNSAHLNNLKIVVAGEKSELIINDESSFFGEALIACSEGTKIAIGKDCMFSNNIIIRTMDAHPIIDEKGKRINHSQDVIIGDHVWIGDHAILNKGACIPDNSIVGSGAVVTKKYDQPGVIIAGNPARIVKTNINWLRK